MFQVNFENNKLIITHPQHSIFDTKTGGHPTVVVYDSEQTARINVDIFKSGRIKVSINVYHQAVWSAGTKFDATEETVASQVATYLNSIFGA